jgi:hypothetical protein
MLETTITEKIALVPPCPTCGKNDNVTLRGTYRRKADSVQRFRCSNPFCKGRIFSDPQRAFVPCGTAPNLKTIGRVLAMRRRGFTYTEIAKAMGCSKQNARYYCLYKRPTRAGTPIGCIFNVILPPELIPDFVGMYQEAMRRRPDASLDLARFISARITNEIAAYRLAHLQKKPDGRQKRAAEYHTIVAIEK